MLDALIVGAGPSGLAAALTLAQNGVKNIRIIEKSESFQVGSRGFGVQPRTFELFKTFGVLEAVQKHATPIPMMRAYKLPGGTEPAKEWSLYPNAEAWPDRPFAGGRCLSQDDLERIFRERLADYGVTVELGKGLTQIEQNVDIVTATVVAFKNTKPTENVEKVEARYLLGCDGARGVSRKLLGLTFEGETKDADGQVWGDVEVEGLTTDFWHVWGQPGKFTIIARPRDPDSASSTRFAWGITGHSFDPAELQLDVPEKVEQFIRENTGRTELQFGTWTWLSKFKPNMRMVNTFQKGRAFCVGDAGHVHSPTGGQGMNNGIQDALNISWKLALVLKGYSSPNILKTFDEERMPIIALMLQATTKLYTKGLVARIESKAELPSGAAPSDASAADDENQSGWFRWRNDALELYGANYRFSSIVHDERTPLENSQDAFDYALSRAYAGYEGLGTLAAGDRLPDAPGLSSMSDAFRSRKTLLDLFSTDKHTVMIFPALEALSVAPTTQVVTLCQEYPKDALQTVVVVPPRIAHAQSPWEKVYGNLVAVVDSDGHARSGYRVGEEATIVIARPDGYIGAIVRDAQGVKRYFDKIFTL